MSKTIPRLPDPAYLMLPASLAGAMRFRPASDAGKGLTGADVALLVIVLGLYAEQPEGAVVEVSHARLQKLYGRVQQSRFVDSLARLEATEMWQGSAWVPALVGHRQSVDRWVFDLDTRLPIGRGAGRAVTIEIEKLRRLSSRYSAVLYLRLQSWLAGVYPSRCPFETIAGHGKRIVAARVTVSMDQIAEFFGFDGNLPPSKIKKLLVTHQSPDSALKRELNMVGVDIDSTFMLSTIATVPAGLRVTLGHISPESGLGEVIVRQKWQRRGQASVNA